MIENVAAIIPARTGNVRLPGKNMLHIGSKPMIQWTMEAAIKAFPIHRIVVTTNDWRVMELAHEFGLAMIVQTEFEQDENASLNVVREAIADRRETFAMLLQPTSPFRDADHIREAWVLFDRSFPVDSLVSVNHADEVNGAIYLFTRARIVNERKPIYGNESVRYRMQERHSLDIDTPADLAKARYLHGIGQ